MRKQESKGHQPHSGPDPMTEETPDDTATRFRSGGGKWVCWWQTTGSGGPRWGGG
ncbi:hypothetical protein E1A91_A10G193700v1 [Gossypium mustelinum]|uniref:Uncharacterized protein n=1 Tax=Gossypium mustelinum TaxID=34275 RepID=A0A5D2XP16_GOSMU|nr:hypothetical protein E1A91_A10G193700v1 [Gossypium mustelinum]